MPGFVPTVYEMVTLTMTYLMVVMIMTGLLTLMPGIVMVPESKS